MVLDTEVLSVVPFLNLRRLLDLALLPVAPRREFRRRLRDQLLAEATPAALAGRSATASIAGGPLALRPGRRDILIGAAVGSAVSLVGLIAFLLHLRSSSRQMSSPAA